jgi:hypothetical protein
MLTHSDTREYRKHSIAHGSNKNLFSYAGVTLSVVVHGITAPCAKCYDIPDTPDTPV